jgi:hypothetical protein
MQAPAGVPPVPLCARCATVIRNAEAVIVDHGAVYHVRCVGTDGPLHVVMAFVKNLAPSPVCHSCISTRLDVPYDDVRKAVGILRLQPGFTVTLIEPCSLCENARVTVRAAAPDTGAQSSP